MNEIMLLLLVPTGNFTFSDVFWYIKNFELTFRPVGKSKNKEENDKKESMED
jgi:hypothetical protein